MSDFVRKHAKHLINRGALKKVARNRAPSAANEARPRRDITLKTSKGELHLMLSDPHPSIW